MFAPRQNTKSTRPANSFGKSGSTPFIQPKLNVGKSGDKYEAEADKMADQVVSKSTNNNSFISPAPAIQKQSDEQIQEKPLANQITPIVQLKSEEDIQTREEENIQSKEEDLQTKEEENIQSKEEDIQTKEEENVQSKEEDIQTKNNSPSGNVQNTTAIADLLQSSKGGGSPLAPSILSEMETKFGADFGDVRIHTDSNAIQMNKILRSQAFVNGKDIYFNQGKYNPRSAKGKHLLAHELTHTIQQGATKSNIQKAKDTITTTESTIEKILKPSNSIDITHRLNLNRSWAEYLDQEYADGKRIFDLNVTIGDRYKGIIKVNKKRTTAEGENAKYELSAGNHRYLEVSGWSFLDPLRNVGVVPIMVLNKFDDEQLTTGFLSVKMADNPLTTDTMGLIKGLNKNLETFGFKGISLIHVEGLENKLERGRLVFQVSALSTEIGGYVEAGGGMGILGDTFNFNLNANVDINGLAKGTFIVGRDDTGQLSGTGQIAASIANIDASLQLEFIDGVMTIQGTGTIESEKFSGSITLLVTDAAKSKQLMNAALNVDEMEGKKESPTIAAATKTKNNQVLAGWGEVSANITPWLQGSAKIGINHKGQVTIVGDVAVQDEVELMEQRGEKIDLFKVEIKAGYGIPLVGQVFLFANIGMFINAGFGPLVLKNIGFTGTYSTDPDVLQNFSITGTLGINAFAIVGLEAEAGVGVTLLGHDVKAGVNVTAAAGLRAYAEATPTFEYNEKNTEEGGKIGESRLKGHFEAAAQLFLALSGSLFYEIDSPWWSPVPDGREDSPLGEVQYPIGDSLGIGADIDWIVGSDDIPKLTLSPISFDPDKFTADIMADPPAKKLGEGEADKEGTWTSDATGKKDDKTKTNKDNKGLGENKKKKENLKLLPDEEKYMRALDEMSKLKDIKPKVSYGVVDSKAKAIKKKYGLDLIRLQNKKDDSINIYVRHKKQNNKKHILVLPLMSDAERILLLHTAMDDLRARETMAIGDTASMTKQEAKALLTTWLTAHPIIEKASVIDGKSTWDYLIDLGDKTGVEKGKLKTEGGGFHHEEVEDEFTNNAGEQHRIYVRKDKNGEYDLMMASSPKVYEMFIQNFNVSTLEGETMKEKAIGLAKEIDTALDLINNKGNKKVVSEKVLDDKVTNLSELTGDLMNIAFGDTLPENQIVFGPLYEGFGTSMAINYLSKSTNQKESSKKKYESHKILESRRSEYGGKTYYNRGHLLHWKLGGPYDWKNLAPITTSMNQNHYKFIEKKLVALLDKDDGSFDPNKTKKAYRYAVVAKYGRGVNEELKKQVDKEDIIPHKVTIKQIIDAEAFVPKSFEIRAFELKPDKNGKWVTHKDLLKGVLTIKNEILQNEPSDYNLDKKSIPEKIDKKDYIDYYNMNPEILEKWFSKRNAIAISYAAQSHGDLIKSHKDLQNYALNWLTSKDKRKIPLKALKRRIKFN